MRKTAIKIYEILKKRMRFAIRMLRKPQIPKNADGKVYVNLGCGMNSGKEFINIDVLPFPNIHYIQDITDLSMFPNESVDMIYGSHVVEHIPRNKLIPTLGEYKRVLKKDGIFRFAVPDFDALVDVYQKTGKNVLNVRDQVLGQEPPYDNHYTLWNFDFAHKLLKDLGFVNIAIWSPDKVQNHDFKDRSGRAIDTPEGSILISLNIEAKKA